MSHCGLCLFVARRDSAGLALPAIRQGRGRWCGGAGVVPPSVSCCHGKGDPSLTCTRYAVAVGRRLLSMLVVSLFVPRSLPQGHGSGGGGSSSSGGSSSAATPGVVMETKLKALVQKLAAIQTKVPILVMCACFGMVALVNFSSICAPPLAVSPLCRACDANVLGHESQRNHDNPPPPSPSLPLRFQWFGGASNEKDPSSKSLVFSQFNSSLEWLKRTLPKKGFQFRTLTGNMSRTQRTAALTVRKGQYSGISLVVVIGACW